MGAIILLFLFLPSLCASPATRNSVGTVLFKQIHDKKLTKMQVKVSVFNYVGDDLPVLLRLEPSTHYHLIGEPSVHLCIGAKDKAVYHFTIDVDQLGTHNITVSASIEGGYPGQCGPEFILSVK